MSQEHVSQEHARIVRLGTRSSPLARWQANWVASQLRDVGTTVELVLVQTEGDVRSGPIGQLGSQGLFTKEIQRALLEDRIDLAVHSLKDLPTEPFPGLQLAAVPPRESPRDVLVSAAGQGVGDLPLGARVGTGSMRRCAQLLAARPDLVVSDVRGNLDTRLRKLDEGQFDALVLAEAGLIRLHLAHRISQVIPYSIMLPAVGQGALGLETRDEDRAMVQLLRSLDDPQSHQSVVAERALLARLHGGCRTPVGAHGRVQDGRLWLDAVVLAADGSRRLTASGSECPANAALLGQQVADDLLGQGAGELLQAARQL